MEAMKLQLFVLRHSKGGAIVEGYTFDNKMDAKQQRDELGGTVVVSPGPDHKLFKGVK